MLFILSRSTVAFPGVLEVRSVPKRFLSLGRRIFPKSVTGALFWRTVFETPLTRYSLALAIFPVLLAMQPGWALAISLAPVPMFAVVLLVETYVLSVSGPEARRALIDPVAADRGLDLLKVRAQDVLTRIAAAHGIDGGTLHLVIEQSELLRIPPLTYVSVQREGADAGFVELDANDRAMIAERLCDDDLDERTLRLINVSQDAPVRVYSLEPSTISAHARLEALAASAPG